MNKKLSIICLLVTCFVSICFGQNILSSRIDKFIGCLDFSVSLDLSQSTFDDSTFKEYFFSGIDDATLPQKEQVENDGERIFKNHLVGFNSNNNYNLDDFSVFIPHKNEKIIILQDYQGEDEQFNIMTLWKIEDDNLMFDKYFKELFNTTNGRTELLNPLIRFEAVYLLLHNVNENSGSYLIYRYFDKKITKLYEKSYSYDLNEIIYNMLECKIYENEQEEPIAMFTEKTYEHNPETNERKMIKASITTVNLLELY